MHDEEYTILIVDDEYINRVALAELLTPYYRVILAKNGDQAMELATSAARPDLILLDVVMPEQSGYDVLRRLRNEERTKDIPVIFVTALSGDDDEEKGLLLGAVDYIVKPFRPAIVRARVRNHLHSVRMRKELEQLVNRDGLTEIANRRHFDIFLDKAWRHAQRSEEPLSVILLDVDHFKKYNDHYGHGAGDEALKKLAGVLESSVRRPYDLAARYGGEEFAVILPNTDALSAQGRAETIRTAIYNLHIDHVASPTNTVLTVSLGGATLPPLPSPNTIDTFLKRVDASLYDAKRNGRNTVAWNAETL
ncbi:diguanylate cyclase [Desulfovibrio inopinatus]|uniref:diguanylate cyclase n=1 Tax=Desulfovibrio inopinatus TaxID=102109 RepID=UPI0003FE1C70|nr:diguanylate cyclase [Desulfovibrio inopinatus]